MWTKSYRELKMGNLCWGGGWRCWGSTNPLTKEMGKYLRQRKGFVRVKRGILAPFCSCKAPSFPQKQPTEISSQPIPLLNFCCDFNSYGRTDSWTKTGIWKGSSGCQFYATENPTMGLQHTAKMLYSSHKLCTGRFYCSLLVLLYPNCFYKDNMLLVPRAFFLPFPDSKVACLRISQDLAFHPLVLTSLFRD